MGIKKAALLSAIILSQFCADTLRAQSCDSAETKAHDAIAYSMLRDRVALYRAGNGWDLLQDSRKAQAEATTSASQRITNNEWVFGGWRKWSELAGPYLGRGDNRRIRQSNDPLKHGWDCSYGYAHQTLAERIAEFGANHPYIEEFVMARNDVFASCVRWGFNGPIPKTLAPRYSKFTRNTPSNKNQDRLSVVKQADDDYNAAAAFYYARNYGPSLTIFEKISTEPQHPHFAIANYMIALVFLRQGKTDEAVAKARGIIANPPGEDVRLLAQELLDVIGSRTGDQALVTNHLRRMDTILSKPRWATDKEIRLAERAKRDLNWFLWTNKSSRNVNHPGEDWWLRDEPVSTSRGNAVLKVSQSSDMMRWLQTMAATGGLERSEWHLPYWQRQDHPGFQRVTDWAWEKWQTTGKHYWLLASAIRLKSDDPRASQIVETSRALIAETKDCAASPYKRAMTQLIGEQAIRTMVQTEDEGLTKNFIFDALPFYANSIAHAEHWYVINSKFDALKNFIELHGLKNRLTSQAAAQSVEDFMSPITGLDHNQLDPGSAGVLNLLSIRSLITAAEQPELNANIRGNILRAAWMRAYLLEKEQLLTEITPLLRDSNPSLSDRLGEIDRTLDPTRKDRLRLALIAANPRMGILVTPFRNEFSKSVKTASGFELRPLNPLSAIDGANRNDNNWWCSFDRERENWKLSVFFDRRTGLGQRNLSEYWYRPDRHRPIKQEIDFLKKFQMLKFIDESELNELEKIESAPRYMANKATEWSQDISVWARLTGEEKYLPETLHHIVKSTRYGCERDGRHGEYSQTIFRILHKSYKWSPWARRTPYWFDCEHFRRQYRASCES